MKENTLESIHSVFKEALGCVGESNNEDNVRAAVDKLCSLHGVEVKTASVILTAWNPVEFAIYDFRVHDLLGLPGNSDSATPRKYLTFLRSLKDLARKLQLDCPLRQVELALWHFYPIQKKGERAFE